MIMKFTTHFRPDPKAQPPVPTSCILAVKNRRFEGICCCYIRGRRVPFCWK